MRTFDALLIAQAIKTFLKTEELCDPIDWVANHNNLALKTGNDLALFEYERPGIATGHYYFESRGKQAVKSAQELLDEAFSPCYNIELIRGLTPLTHLGARWMNRKLGFTSQGVVKTTTGPHELFILTKKEHSV